MIPSLLSGCGISDDKSVWACRNFNSTVILFRGVRLGLRGPRADGRSKTGMNFEIAQFLLKFPENTCYMVAGVLSRFSKIPRVFASALKRILRAGPFPAFARILCIKLQACQRPSLVFSTCRTNSHELSLEHEVSLSLREHVNRQTTAVITTV
jgi:hypothetical protein